MRNLFLSFLLTLLILAQPSSGLQSSFASEPRETFLVLLREPSVVERVIDWTSDFSLRSRRQALFSSPARSEHDELHDYQDRVIQRLQAYRTQAESLSLLEQRAFLMNLLVVETTPRLAAVLKEDREVRGVYPNPPRYPLLDSAPSLVQAESVWNRVGGSEEAGRDIRIAIIDSGIQHLHPMFRDAGFQPPAGFPRGAAEFTNAKVIVARNYVLPAFGLKAQPNETPGDERGHGTAVAAIAAGRVTQAPLAEISGMAPGAFLGNYKVFGQPGVNDSSTSAAVIAALNDAVEDGMDVVNLSLGGEPRLPDQDPEQMAIALAVEAGVVVVAAAGNRGPDPGTILSPGTSPHVITVGAGSNGRFFSRALELNATSGVLPEQLKRIVYEPSSNTRTAQSVGPLPLVSLRSLDPSEEACSPFPAESFEGRAALVRRGACLFSTKARHVFEAGAAAMVVYNNIEGPPVSMDIAGRPSTDPPSVMIAMGRGTALRDLLEGGMEIEVVILSDQELRPFPAPGNRLASFSGRGPSIDLTIKPDVIAPGENVYTASRNVEPQPQFFRGISGTSFATPLVSGAAALIRQLRAEWANRLPPAMLARAVKSVLVNTARSDLLWEAEPARPLQIGNGILNLERAVRTETVLDPVSLSFGSWNPAVTSAVQRTLHLTNLTGQPHTYRVDIHHTQNNPGVTLLFSPAELRLEEGQTGQVTVSAASVLPAEAGAFEGTLVILSQDGTQRITAPFWGALTVEEPSRKLQVSQTGGGEFHSLSAALDAARPGNVVEITDSGIYSGALRLRLNRDGVPLHGLTLTAAPGQSPTLEGDDFGFSPVITVADLEDVTIRGLKIRGGGGGIRFENSTGVVRDSIIETVRTDGTGTGAVHLDRSRIHLLDSVIRDNPGDSLQAGESSAVLVQGSRFENGGGSGLLLEGAWPSAVFDSEIAGSGGSGGRGVHLIDTSALIKSSTIRATRGSQGDGILIEGPQVEVLVQDSLISENRRHGLRAANRARLTLLRSRIEDNLAAGLSAVGSSRLTARSNRFFGNRRGAILSNSTVLFSDSLFAASHGEEDGDGLHAFLSTLEVFNSTFAGNVGVGVRLVGGEALFANSILAENSRGDIVGGSPTFFASNLIGDGSFAGQNENFAAEPLFVDAAGGDFRLLAGSPALDRASESFPIAPHDLLFRERRVPSSPGLPARADLGAFEHNSEWVPALILPVFSTDRDHFVGVALANAYVPPDPEDGRAARVRMTAYDVDGSERGSLEQEVLPGRQISFLLRELFDPLDEGWIEIRSDLPDLMSFSLLGDFGWTFLDGVRLDAEASGEFVFPEIRNGNQEETRLFLVNPHEVPVQITMVAVGRDRSAQEVSAAVPARGALHTSVGERFGEGDFSHVLVRSEEGLPLHGVQLFGTAESQGGLSARPVDRTFSTLYSAHLASAPGVESFLSLVNLGPSADIRIEVLDETGRIAATRLIEQLAENESLRVGMRDLLDSEEEIVVGWLRVTSDPASSLAGSVTFGDPAGRFLASQPLQGSGAREFVFSHVAHTEEMFTGLALVNPNPETALVAMQIFDVEGNPTGQALTELPGGHKRARLLHELIPELPHQAGGFVRVRSTLRLQAMQLFGDYAEEFLAAVPQQTVAR